MRALKGLSFIYKNRYYLDLSKKGVDKDVFVYYCTK